MGRETADAFDTRSPSAPMPPFSADPRALPARFAASPLFTLSSNSCRDIRFFFPGEALPPDCIDDTRSALLAPRDGDDAPAGDVFFFSAFAFAAAASFSCCCFFFSLSTSRLDGARSARGVEKLGISTPLSVYDGADDDRGFGTRAGGA